jgi:hypothetical protein
MPSSPMVFLLHPLMRARLNMRIFMKTIRLIVGEWW